MADGCRALIELPGSADTAVAGWKCTGRIPWIEITGTSAEYP